MSKRVGLIMIGDELLNGSRQDKHMSQVINILNQRGMALAWTRMIADEEDMITNTLRQTQNSPEIVFSFGGIGATPDDLTRDCAAIAFGLKLQRHPQAVSLLERRFGDEAYPRRIHMAELPNSCTLIPNEINQIPGFKIADHHFLPGFPNMAWPMIEWSLDTFYPHHFHTTMEAEQRWILSDVAESELVDMMETLMQRFKGTKISSLPSTTTPRQIDFGIKGDKQPVAQAATWLEQQLQTMNITFQASTPNQ